MPAKQAATGTSITPSEGALADVRFVALLCQQVSLAIVKEGCISALGPAQSEQEGASPNHVGR